MPLFAKYPRFYTAANNGVYTPAGVSSDEAKGARKRFHCRVTRRGDLSVRGILSSYREEVEELLKLRQAHHPFWYQDKQPALSDSKWEEEFQSQVRRSVNRLNALGTEGNTERTLDDVFRRLSVVRNQIVHGGSSGTRSRGVSQVRLGDTLLKALVPRFRDIIKSNLKEDWGRPPFPRVGKPDQECPPPWLKEQYRTC